jgi:hypothetical protein
MAVDSACKPGAVARSFQGYQIPQCQPAYNVLFVLLKVTKLVQPLRNGPLVREVLSNALLERCILMSVSDHFQAAMW